MWFVCGTHIRTRCLPTMAVNEKGGMNASKLFDCFNVNILPLFPDAQDFPTKWVVLKTDSGPGRVNLEMLVHMQSHGVHLFPGVPNTTQVTQETDQNYGPFKWVYRSNVDALHKSTGSPKKAIVAPLT